jgi:hypothetical protein
MKLKRGSLFTSLLILLSVFFTIELSAQGTTYNNITGFWTEPSIWETGFPSSENLSGQTIINGTVFINGDLRNRKGQIIINDTLIIRGDLKLKYESTLQINNNAVLIVYGKAYFSNKTNIQVDGTFIIEDHFIAFGSKSRIEFGNDGKLFIIGKLLKGSSRNFPLLNCNPNDYPGNCYYGNLSKLEQDPAYSIYSSGGYRIKHQGKLNLCDGELVKLYVSPSVPEIQWFKNGISLVGETNDTLVVSESGLYSARITDFIVPASLLDIYEISQILSGMGYFAHIKELYSQSYTLTDVHIQTFNLPEIELGDDQETCYGNTISLDAGSEYSTYQWSTGEISQEIEISDVSNNKYWVSVEDSNGCQNNSDTVSVEIHELPAVTLGTDKESCYGEPVLLDGGNDFSTYLWNTGEISQEIEISETGSNEYWVSVEDSNGCQNNSDTVSVEIHELPAVTLGTDKEACFGDSVILDAGGDFSAYQWNTGETKQELHLSDQGIGEYWVTVEDINGCIGKSDTVSVKINSVPTAYINGTDTICNGQSITLTASGGTTYQWNTGENTSSITTNPSENITYNVITSNEFECTDTAYFDVIVKEGFNLSINGVSEVCAGSNTVLSITEGSDINWSTGETALNITVLPLTNTEISVSARNSVGCYDTASIVLEVLPLPQLNVTGNQTICEGETSLLAVTGGVSYIWSNGSTSSSVQLSSDDLLQYWVKGTNEYSCSDTVFGSLTIYENPVGSITGDTVLCDGQTGTLLASGGVSYLWNNGLSSSSLSISPEESTEYSVIISNENGCKDTVAVTVEISQPDIAVITGPTSHCSGETTVLTASGGTFYQWSTGEDSQSIEINPDSTTQYWVVVSDDKGCQDTAKTTIIVSSFDNFACPKDLGSISKWISASGEFNNAQATPDGDNVSCWNEQPGNNIWFKFTAEIPVQSVTIRTGSIYGSMKGQQLLITSEDGNEIACNESPDNYQGPLSVYTNFAAGNTYYIMVDDRSNHGTFTLSINDYQSNDEFSNAIVINDPSSYTSSPFEFTTLGATRDGNKINCTNERPNNNVWYKFKANARTNTIQVSAGENKGTISDPVITLYDADQEQLSCNTQNGNNSIKLSYKDLIPGNWYYFSVSNVNDLTGSFTLSTNNNINPGNIYYAVKDGNWNSNIWSENPYDTEGRGIVPSSDDIVYIKNHQVDVNSIVYAYSVYILLSNTTALNVSPGAKVELVKRMYLYNE